MSAVTDQDLFNLILKADEQAFARGEDPKQRAFTVPGKVMAELGFQGYVMICRDAPSELVRIHAIINQLYRPNDIATGGIHLGMFMFRDIFSLIRIPIIFGQVGIDPLKMTDMNESQTKWLASSPSELAIYYDQFTDIMDFGYGVMEMGHATIPADALGMMGLARFQLQAASSVLGVAYDFRGAIQSALIGTELAIKAGLLAAGLTEAEVTKFGHKLDAAAGALAQVKSGFDEARVHATIKTFPAYVANRYAASQPTRRETGRIVMGAQYVAGEVMRQFSARDFRAAGGPPLPRSYPPL